jgi:hypothetical protein
VVYINWLPSKQKENGVRACARGSCCGLGPVGIDKYNKKIMIANIRDPNLFRVGNQFNHDMDIKRLGINPLVKRCEINPAIWFLVVLIMMSKLVLEPK